MSEALAALALVAGDELAGAPALLVEDGAALVAQRAARVVLALARVLLQRGWGINHDLYKLTHDVVL